MRVHVRVKSSTRVKIRITRPSPSVSCTKSIDQRSFGAMGTGRGTRAVVTRFRRRFRTVRPASPYNRWTRLRFTGQPSRTSKPVEPPIAPARLQDRERLEALAQRLIVARQAILLRRARHAHHATRPRFGHAGGGHRLVDRDPPR